MLVLGCCAVWGQYDVNFSHYFDMEPWFNPAAAGKKAVINVTGAYAMTMAGFEHNPNTFYVGADMPFFALNNYHGVGLNLMSDKIGLFTHQRIAAQYAFRRKLFGGDLSAGIQAGLLSETFNGSEVVLREPEDDVFS